MPRVVTFDPQLQRLNFFPVPELHHFFASEHTGTRVTHQLVKGTTPVLSSQAAQSEVRVRFSVPTRPVRLGVSFMVGAATVQEGENALATEIFMEPGGLDAGSGGDSVRSKKCS